MYRIYYLTKIMLIYNIIYVNSLSNNVIEEIPETLANITSENDLWSKLLGNCVPPSFTCIRNNVHDYLKSILDYPDDIQFTSFLKFTKNLIDYNKPVFDEFANETSNLTEFGDSFPAEDVTRSLTENTVKFLMTHDLELHLPDTFFLGGTIKVSPKSLEEDGPMVKLQLIPKSHQSNGEGRLFFKRIRKFISQRLIYALLAILLVIKLLAVKLLFVLPAIVGVATAKKILLKVLLFLFPALHHLFKLCAYVPYGAKHHIHKHQISHIHEIGHSHHQHPEASYKRKGHIDPDLSHAPLKHFSDHRVHEVPYENEYQDTSYFGKSSNGHRKKLQINKEIGVWNQNQGGTPTNYVESDRPLTPTDIENMVLFSQREAELKALLQKQKQKLLKENIHLQQELNYAVNLQEKLKHQAALVLNSKIFHGNIYPKIRSNATQLSPFRQNVLTDSLNSMQFSIQNYSSKTSDKNKIERNVVENNKPSRGNMYSSEIIQLDPFYSPILEKIDRVLQIFGLSEESCKEKLICSMYRNPLKFTPHSNLLSVELSRDSKDLQKPTSTNAAAIRFYRYVQAARDGQDKRDCSKLYPMCKFNTDLRK